MHRHINPAQVLTDKQLEPVRKSLNKEGLIRLDGIEALVDILGESTFIKYAIETSFFFDNDAAYNRFVQMSNVITGGKPDALFPKSGVALPARKTNNGTHVTVNGTMWFVDVNGNTICPIIEDGNNNSKPHSMINTLFGYNQLLQRLDFHHHS